MLYTINSHVRCIPSKSPETFLKTELPILLRRMTAFIRAQGVIKGIPILSLFYSIVLIKLSLLRFLEMCHFLWLLFVCIVPLTRLAVDYDFKNILFYIQGGPCKTFQAGLKSKSGKRLDW